MTVAFALDGPLPGTGTTLLEASAGTGKTYALEGLVTRFVADAVARLDQVLVVTFTRAATSELRDRVRRRLVHAAAALAADAGGRPLPAWPDGRPTDPADDPVLRALLDGGPADRRARGERLAAAIAAYDTATIATIHGFCADALRGLGAGLRGALVTDQRALLAEVVDDCYLRGFHDADDALLALRPPRDHVLAIADAALANPDADIQPHAGADSTAALRAAFAVRARQEAVRYKRRRGLVSFDDLQTRLAHALADEGALQTLRERYVVGLVDEFQDTDPTQWQIMRRLFDGRRLILVGDPKQAIYRFRGGDVHAFLRARQQAQVRSLPVNQRSDAGFVRACNTLLAGAELGSEAGQVPCAPVGSRTAPDRLRGGVGAGIQLRIGTAAAGLADPQGGTVPAEVARARIAQDVRRVVTELTAGAVEVDDPAGRTRPLAPRDVAVLVRTNAEAAQVHHTLLDGGLPAVVNGVGDVFSTPAARHWHTLLVALDRPSDASLVRQVAVGPFGTLTAAEVAGRADDRDWEDEHIRLHELAAVARTQGIAALQQRVLQPARLLRRAAGRRLVADLDHVAELLHRAMAGEGLGLSALAGWLALRIDEAEELPRADAHARRMESDADAVQVLTVHRAKGLEFPVVLCPYLWSDGGQDYQFCLYPDGDRRVLHVGGKGTWGDRWRRKTAEEEAEARRVLYVALTRARHRAVVWVPVVRGGDRCQLAQLLFRDVAQPSSAAAAWEGARELAARAPDVLEAVAIPALDDDNGRRAAAADTAGRRSATARPTPTAPRPAGTAHPPADTADTAHPPADTAGTAGAAHPPADAADTADTAHPPADTAGAAGAAHPPADAAGTAGAAAEGSELMTATFARTVDRVWRRTSYSGWINDTELADLGVGGDRTVGDETVPVTATGGPDGGERPAGPLPLPDDLAPLEVLAPDDPLRLPLPLGGMPGGAEVGTAVHGVLERVDFAADVDTVAAAVDEREQREHIGLHGALPPGAVAAGLMDVLATPLGPLAGPRALRDIPRSDRLDEIAFEFPVAGGDNQPVAGGDNQPVAGGDNQPVAGSDHPPGRPVRAADLAAMLRRHLPADDPLAAYPDALDRDGPATPLAGFLAGRIDLVARVDGGVLVADHKTNWLGRQAGEPLHAWHYQPRRLAATMIRHHYPLQALIYQVAVHRYLRWRQPGYDPDRHLRGVLYLFVRGMAGPATPWVGGHPCGVFAWRPPTALLLELDQLLAVGSGGSAGAASAPKAAATTAQTRPPKATATTEAAPTTEHARPPKATATTEAAPTTEHGRPPEADTTGERAAPE